MKAGQLPVRAHLSPHVAKMLVALIIAISYYVIFNRFDASRALALEARAGAAGAENDYAVQQRGATWTSAAGFGAIGVMGSICWLTAPPERLCFNRGLFFLAVLAIGWCSASVLWSSDPIHTIRKLGILHLMLLGAAGLAAKFELEDFLEIAVIVLLALMTVGVAAEALTGAFRPWRSDYRFTGTLHPNDLAVQCAIMAIAAALMRNSTWLRWPIVFAGLSGLWFSKSRTTLAALVAAAAVFYLLRLQGRRRWLVVSAGVVLASLGALVFSFASPATVREARNVVQMGRGEQISTLTGRLPLWSQLAREAAKRPWSGTGFESFWSSQNILKFSKMNGWQIPHAHNNYLDFILATGLIGLLVYGAWIFATTVAATIRYERSGRLAHLFVVCLAALAAVHSLAESKLPGASLPGFLLLTAMVMEAIQTSAFETPMPAFAPVSAQAGASRPTLCATRRRFTGTQPSPASNRHYGSSC